jgi:hypothetical protein
MKAGNSSRHARLNRVRERSLAAPGNTSKVPQTFVSHRDAVSF